MMRLSLVTAALRSLGRIVPQPKFGGIEQDAKDLRVGGSSPASQNEEGSKHYYAAYEASEEIEGPSSDDQGHKKERAFGAPDRQGSVDRLVDGMGGGSVLHRMCPPYPKSHERKLTPPMAIPTPKMIPANMRLDSPSPNANISPPTTMAIRLNPFAIGPVKDACSTLTAC